VVGPFVTSSPVRHDVLVIMGYYIVFPLHAALKEFLENVCNRAEVGTGITQTAGSSRKPSYHVAV
jgi:hypothetical protein